MTNQIFNEMDYRLSVVQRWSTVFTLRKSSIAEHSYFVTLIASRIARKWFGLVDPYTLYGVMRVAMEHDNREAVSGDIPSPTKKYWNAEKFEADHGDKFADDLPWASDLVYEIVKVADFIAALIELKMEMSFGNNSVALHYYQLWLRFEGFCITSKYSKTSPNMYKVVEDDLFDSDGKFIAMPTEYK